MDAQVAYGFHHLRNEKPHLEQGPISNKVISPSLGYKIFMHLYIWSLILPGPFLLMAISYLETVLIEESKEHKRESKHQENPWKGKQWEKSHLLEHKMKKRKEKQNLKGW